MYAEPIKIFGVTIEDIGETSGKRSDASNDHQEEEVELHSKRLEQIIKFITSHKLKSVADQDVIAI